MIAPVIVPLDGSASAERALPMAVAVTRRTGAPLHLVCVNPGTPAAGRPGAGSGDPAEGREQRASAGAYLGEVALRLAEGGVPGTIVAAQIEGPVVRALVGYSRRQGGLLVMTTHGHGNGAGGLMGEVADRVIRWSGEPVLLIPVAGAPSGAERWCCERVLLAVEDATSTAAVLGPTITLANTFGAEVTVVCGSDAPTPLPHPRPLPRWRGAASPSDELRPELLASVTRQLRHAGCPVAVRTLPGRLDGSALASAALELGVDVVAGAVGGRADPDELRYGSALSAVLRGVAVPVLVRCRRVGAAGGPGKAGEHTRAEPATAPAA